MTKTLHTLQLNTAELVILNNLDLGELYQFEQARKLSHELLTNWLSEYKFKDWIDSSTGKPVTKKKKRERAEEIAEILSNNEKWRSHGRMITRDTLTSKSENLRLSNNTPAIKPGVLLFLITQFQ